MQGTAFKARKKDGSQCKELQILLAHFKLKEALKRIACQGQRFQIINKRLKDEQKEFPSLVFVF